MSASAPYARRSFAGGAISTTIPTGMGPTDTSFTIALASGWSFANDFFVVVDRGLATEEKIECTGISGLVVSVAARGADGTSAAAHSPGCFVQVCHVAQDDDEANQVVNQVLGQSGAAKGDLLFMESAAGPNTLNRLGIGSNGSVLSAASGVPAWSTAGTSGQYLTSAGSSVPTWATLPTSNAAQNASAGSGTTTSSTFGNLSSTSAAVTVTTGTLALVTVSGEVFNSSNGHWAYLGFKVSGATTISGATSKAFAIQESSASPAGGVIQGSYTTLVTLTAGSNTFTAQLANDDNTSTANASNVFITVVPLN